MAAILRCSSAVDSWQRSWEVLVTFDSWQRSWDFLVTFDSWQRSWDVQVTLTEILRCPSDFDSWQRSRDVLVTFDSWQRSWDVQVTFDGWHSFGLNTYTPFLILAFCLHQLLFQFKHCLSKLADIIFRVLSCSALTPCFFKRLDTGT